MGALHDLRGTLGEWRYTRPGRRVVQAVRVASAPGEFLRRRQAAGAALRAHRPARGVDPDTGYVILEPRALQGTDDLLQACERELVRMSQHLRSLRTDRYSIVADLGTDALIEREPTFVRFALQDALLLRAVDYLSTVPFVARISLGISYPRSDAGEPVYFQRFHVDNEDFRQIKVYVCARDTGPDDGPLTFLPAGPSARVLEALRRSGQPRRRKTTWSDADVFRHCDPSELVSVTGRKGTAALVDLSRCLHFGSRVRPGCERVVMGVNFLRYHRVHEHPSNQIDPRHAHGDALRELALLGPRRYSPGRFFPDLLPAGAS